MEKIHKGNEKAETSPKTKLINKTQTSPESHHTRKTSTQATKMRYKTGQEPNRDPRRSKTKGYTPPEDLEKY